MTNSEDFIKKFRNLDGVLLKEKKKSFHNLLSTIQTSPEILDEIITNLKPSTYLEANFKIDLLIHFKRTNDLLEILKDGEEIGSMRVIRQSWFIKDLMRELSANDFVEQIFPSLSLIVRTKLLKKILIDIEDKSKIVELFEKFSEIYGLNVSLVLLPGCPSDKIKEYLRNSSTRPSATQLKKLFDKDRTIITDYFDDLKRDDKFIDDYKWSSFFDYIGIKDPVFYYELSKKYKIYIRRLGRRSTKKFVNSQREKILENPNEFRFLKDDALVHELGEDFPKFYKKALPKNLSSFNYCRAVTLLKYYPKHKQYDLYFDTFQETYNRSLWIHTDYMDERLIEFIADKELRDKWISRFEDRRNIEKYKKRKSKMCMMSMARCMEFEDDVGIGENAIAERKTIFNTLISTCKLTKDYDAFLNILKSFCARHRNSDITTLYNFLRTIHKELHMERLNEEHWKYIYEIISILLFKKQQIYYHIFVEYIKFQYLQKKDVENLISTLLKEKPGNLSTFEYRNEEFQKMMLEKYVEYLPQIQDHQSFLTIQIALAVMKWNKTHQNDTFSISNQNKVWKTVIAFLKNSDKINRDTMKVFKYLICRQNGVQEASELDEFYWSNFKKFNNKTITMWFVKYKPNVLKENLEKIGIMLKEKNVNLNRTLKKYDHLNIPTEIMNICLKELGKGEVSKNARIIKIMVIFMATKNMKQYFNKFIPDVDRVKVENADDVIKKFYEIQCALGRYIKSADNPKNYLADLLRFCRGDVLASSLPSLYSSFCRIPEKDLYSSLEELSTKAVSVRKHAIFLSTFILPQEQIIAKFKEIETEPNSTVRQYIFITCYRFFWINGHPECWSILENYISTIKKEQKDAIKLLTEIKIPRNYRVTFIQLMWNTLDKMKKENEDISTEMETLLNKIEKSDVKNLPHEFCETIIKKLFDLTECEMNRTVFQFVKKFLLYSELSEKNIELVLINLRDFNEYFKNDDEKSIKSLQVIYKVCFYILEDMLGEDVEHVDKNFPKLFKKVWNTVLKKEETFEENLLIDFVIFRMRSGIKTESLAQQIEKNFRSALKKYGNVIIISSFKNFLSSTLRRVLSHDNYYQDLFSFLDNFIDINNSLEHCALVIELLPIGQYLDDDDQVPYKKLIEKLSKMGGSVKIYLYGKMKSID